MPTLYGPDGQPIDTSLLKKEVAGPTVSGVRSHLTGHPSAGLTPVRLARILRDAEDGDAIRYLELAEQMEEKDLHYLAVIGTRKRQVSQLEITVDAVSDDKNDIANADLVREAFQRDDVEDELFHVLDAVGKGFSATEIMWEVSERQWMPTRLQWRDPRWFEFDRADGATPLLLADDGTRQPLAPFKFVYHTHTAKSGLPIRGGLARVAAWAYLFKNFGIKGWVAFAEAFGQPIRVGKYHPSATEADKEILLRAVRSLHSDCAAIIPESMIVELIKAEVRGTVDLYERQANFFDYQVSKAVLGQTTTTDAVSGGHAVSQEHDKVREDIERADAKQVAATLRRDLVRPIVDLNRGPQKQYPLLKIGRRNQVDMDKLSQQLERLVPLGLEVEQSVVRDMMGLPDPAKGAVLLRPTNVVTEPPATDKIKDEARAKATAGEEPPPRDPADDIAEQAEAFAAPAMDALIDKVKMLMHESGDLETLRDRLLELYPTLAIGDLAEAMRRAMVVADLTGRADAIDG